MAVIHYAKSCNKGDFTACGKRAWYKRTVQTRIRYCATCEKCLEVLRKQDFRKYTEMLRDQDNKQ